MTKLTDEENGLGKGITATGDDRLKKQAGEGRDARSSQDRRLTQDRELQDATRSESRRQDFKAAILPDPPAIPGFHCIWLSTTHAADTIQSRLQKGYLPVKAEDIPGYDGWQIKSGEWQGYIGVREMLLFKLPNELWAEDMQYLHHDAPMQEEQGIKNEAEGLKNSLEAEGTTTISIAGGIQELAKKVKRPVW